MARTAKPDLRLLDAIRATQQLDDTVPPTEPPPSVMLAQPKQHRVVAWRHDGGMRDVTCETLEKAREHMAGLHWAVYWKAMIMCGREMVERRQIGEETAA